MNLEPNGRPEVVEPSEVAIPVAEFEGEFVRSMVGKLPAVPMDMPEGYKRGTHLVFGVEVRVRNVSYEEDKHGDLSRVHHFALEEVKLLEAFNAEHRPTNVGGSVAGDAWLPALLSYVRGDTETFEYDGEDLPDRLRVLTKGDEAEAEPEWAAPIRREFADFADF